MAETGKTKTVDLSDFEKSMARIEEIVRLLENGKVGLEESMKLYEEGISLIGKCSGQLDSAERRIKILQKKNGVIAESDFVRSGDGTDEN